MRKPRKPAKPWHKPHALDVGDWWFDYASFGRDKTGKLMWKRTCRPKTNGYDRFVVYVHPLDTTEEIAARLGAEISAANTLLDYRRSIGIRE